MVTHSKKKTYAAILILGAVALAVDRFALSDSASAPASVIAQETTLPTSTERKANDSPASVPIPELPFPRGLEMFDAGGKLRDLFAPPQAFSDADSKNAAPDKNDRGTAQGTVDSQLTSAKFVTQHKLDAVLVHQRLRIAVVDGVWLRIGNVIAGCTLEGIVGRTALFSCHDGEVVLDMVDGLELSSD